MFVHILLRQTHASLARSLATLMDHKRHRKLAAICIQGVCAHVGYERWVVERCARLRDLDRDTHFIEPTICDRNEPIE